MGSRGPHRSGCSCRIPLFFCQALQITSSFTLKLANLAMIEWGFTCESVGLGTRARCALLTLSSISSGRSSESLNKFIRKLEILSPSASSGMPLIRILSLRSRPSWLISLAYMLAWRCENLFNSVVAACSAVSASSIQLSASSSL